MPRQFMYNAAMPKRRLTFLFSLALFTGSLLVFWVQPMLAKRVLPLLGGAPAVWTTAQVFFQLLLLAGYLYAHGLSRRLAPRGQAAVHLALLALACAWLWLPRTDPAPPATTDPVFWQLAFLARAIGLPFLALAAGAPLLQDWFSRTGHRRARDPFFLYAASNLGSMAGLLGYILVIEPALGLEGQRRAWAAGFGLLALLAALCALTLPPGRTRAPAGGEPPEASSPAPTFRRRARWVFLSFVPSSLMLGVTAYLATDIASIPLLWTAPLLLYLLTFVIAFGRRASAAPGAPGIAARALRMTVLILLFVWLAGIRDPVWLVLLLALAGFFAVALAVHLRLAGDRPGRDHLTGFYLWLAMGGALGGLFNSLLAPRIFSGVTEYPLVILLSLLAVPLDASRNAPGNSGRWRRAAVDLAFALALFALARLLATALPAAVPFRTRVLLAVALPLVLAYLASQRPRRYALALAAVWLAVLLTPGDEGTLLFRRRNFFGTLRVTADAGGPFHRFYHGTTLHGLQFTTPGRRDEPLAYYHRLGPCGAVMARHEQVPAGNRVAVVGLGIGATLAYARPDEEWTVYEIDPEVVRVARDGPWFSHWRRSPARSVRPVIGDARLGLQRAAPGGFSLIILDAFSSDSVPVHLLTREAMRLYLSRLAPGGLIAANISSWSMDLGKVMAGLAADAGLACINWRDDRALPPSPATLGKYPSSWVVLARRAEDLGGLAFDPRWKRLRPLPGVRVWTDSHSDILGVLNWR